MDIHIHLGQPAGSQPYLDRLAGIFEKMDKRYDETARKYGFICTGCSDSCCRTRFFHHTLMEYFYMKAGLESLNPSERDMIHSRACKVNSKWEKHAGSDPGVMCPLNNAGRCRLYAYRPMICRLHGLPHELNHPVKGRSQGPGCHEFVIRCGEKPYVPFDRTTLYRELADLEKSFRQETGLSMKMKMTVAEMLSDGSNVNSGYHE